MTSCRLTPIVLASLTFVMSLAGCAATDHAAKPNANAQPPEFKLPPGWTEADMQACMIAGTPGKEQERLLKDVGTWKGRSTMWMYPGSEPMHTEATLKVTSFMDGRYAKTEWTGEMPGMGPYKGFGLTGYDNIAGKHVNLWVDNQSTGLMTGAGERSADGGTMTWLFPYTCAITRKPGVFRQIEKNPGPDRKIIEMFGNDPKTGVEYKMMLIELARQ